MGPEGSSAATSFTDKIPPSFDGHSRYKLYRQDVELWLCLTNLDDTKQGPASIGRLSGEPKSSAKSLGTAAISAPGGALKILEHLDRSYGGDDTDQLDTDLAAFLDYSWDNRTSIETCIAGFHARLDKLAELNLNSKLQGHLLLRQARIDTHSKNMIIGASSGSYEVRAISSALRQAFRNYSDSSMVTGSPRGGEKDPNEISNNRMPLLQEKKAISSVTAENCWPGPEKMAKARIHLPRNALRAPQSRLPFTATLVSPPKLPLGH